MQCVRKGDIEKELNLRQKIKVDPYGRGFEHATHKGNIHVLRNQDFGFFDPPLWLRNTWMFFYDDIYYKILWKYWCMKIWMPFQKRFHPAALWVEYISLLYQNSNDHFWRIHEKSYCLEVCCHLFFDCIYQEKTTCHQNPYKMAAEFFKNSTKILFWKADGISSIDSIFAKLIP